MNKSAAFNAGVQATLEKMAEGEVRKFFGGLLKRKKPKPKFVPSFKGHNEAIRKAVGRTKSMTSTGIETLRKFNPMTQAIQQKRYVTGVPGWS